MFGGSGFYEFLDDMEVAKVETPYGELSAAVTLGTVGGLQVAFLPRHGEHHQWSASTVNYRANVWAMYELGVRSIIGPCAVGSLHADLEPGSFVVLDQLIDRTKNRIDTFFDRELFHLSFAEPYCPRLQRALVEAAQEMKTTVHSSGTVVVIEGPRFSTKAESHMFRTFGADVVNMTQYPEVALARELGMCYAGLALVTDYDSGVSEIKSEAVTMQDVFAQLEANVVVARKLLQHTIPHVYEHHCDCASSSGPVENLMR